MCLLFLNNSRRLRDAIQQACLTANTEPSRHKYCSVLSGFASSDYLRMHVARIIVCHQRLRRIKQAVYANLEEANFMTLNMIRAYMTPQYGRVYTIYKKGNLPHGRIACKVANYRLSPSRHCSAGGVRIEMPDALPEY